jgi:hypothetical protein
MNTKRNTKNIVNIINVLKRMRMKILSERERLEIMKLTRLR